MDIPKKLCILSVVRDLQQDVAENEAENLLQLQMYWNAASNTSMRIAMLALIGTMPRRAARGERCSVRGFATVTVPSYNDSEFRDHFRMSRLCYTVGRLTLNYNMIRLIPYAQGRALRYKFYC